MTYQKHPRGKNNHKTIKLNGEIKGDNPKIKYKSSQPFTPTRTEKIIAGWIWLAFIAGVITTFYYWWYG